MTSNHKSNHKSNHNFSIGLAIGLVIGSAIGFIVTYCYNYKEEIENDEIVDDEIEENKEMDLTPLMPLIQNIANVVVGNLSHINSTQNPVDVKFICSNYRNLFDKPLPPCVLIAIII